MAKYDCSPLKVPNEYIEASPGFSLDIGCSTAKLIYRSNEDYKDGKPIKKELKGPMGRVFLVSGIPRTDVDEVIKIIRAKCDLRQAKGGAKTKVSTTGAGCNFFRDQIESELNVRLTNTNEMGCFTQAFVEISKHLKYDDIFEDIDEKTAADAKKEEELFDKIAPSIASWGFDTSCRATKADIEAEKKLPKAVLPCLITMCGSGVGYLRVQEDGKFALCGLNIFGGRAFLGLAALTTGAKEFSRVQYGYDHGSTEGIDEYADDLVASSSKKGKSSSDSYKVLKELERPIFAFGKAVTRDRDQIPDDDILHSLYRTFLINMVDKARAHCCMYGLKNMYFCGNFAQNPTGRHIIQVHNAGENVYAPKDCRVQVKFIKNGGHLGALGAFIRNKDMKGDEEGSIGSSA